MGRSYSQNVYFQLAVFKILKAKRIGKRYLGRPRHRPEGIVKIDLKEIGINTRN